MALEVLRTTVLGRDVRLYVDPHVFTPTLTTSVLTNQVDLARLKGSTVLDLGCGTGPIAIGLALAGAAHVFAIDLMEQACELARRNAELNGVAAQVTVLQGDLFQPVADRQFDLIVDDVSGVAEDVARLSSWFPSEVPSGGFDGTRQTVRMVKSSPRHLKPNGYLLFPVLSLSKAAAIVSVARDAYGAGLQCVVTKRVPFNAQLKSNIDVLARLKESGVIDFDQVRSRHFWTLDIFRAENSNLPERA